MKRTTPGHPKVATFAITLGCSELEALGMLELLWHTTAKFVPRGNIGRWPDLWIGKQLHTEQLHTPQPADAVIAALATATLLDAHDEHRFLIHDWPQHAEDSVHMQLARAGLYFADGTVPSLSRFSQKERDTLLERFPHLKRSKSVRTASAAKRTTGAEQRTASALPSHAMPSHATSSVGATTADPVGVVDTANVMTLDAWTAEQPTTLRAALAAADRQYPAVEFILRPFLAIHAHFRGGPCGVDAMARALDTLRNHSHQLAVILGAWVRYCDPATNPDNPLYVNPQKFVQTFNAWLPGAPRPGTNQPVATEGERAWGEVLAAMRKGGRYVGFPADTPFGERLKRVVDRIGFSRICDSTNIAVERANFLRLYAVESEGTTPAPAGRAPARSTIRGAAAILVPLVATVLAAGGIL